MAKKGNRVQVILECTEHKSSGMPGTSRYITTKNKKNTPDRMELKKFNSILSGVFFLFFVVIYLDVPGLPEVLCSVHSKIT